MGSPGRIAGSPPPRAHNTPDSSIPDHRQKDKLISALKTYSRDLSYLFSQDKNFTVDDFLRYSRDSPDRGAAWRKGANAIALSLADQYQGKSVRERDDFLEKQLQGMTGQKLHDILQAEIKKAIDTTNKVAQGGPGKEGFSGDEIIDAQERDELWQKNSVAAAVLDYVVGSFEQPAPYQRR